jgi:hypothetical protein
VPSDLTQPALAECNGGTGGLRSSRGGARVTARATFWQAEQL